MNTSGDAGSAGGGSPSHTPSSSTPLSGGSLSRTPSIRAPAGDGSCCHVSSPRMPPGGGSSRHPSLHATPAPSSDQLPPFVRQGLVPGPPLPCAHCDAAPSDPVAGVTPFAVDLDAVRAAAASLQTFEARHRELQAAYQQVVQDLVASRRHNEELHALLVPRFDVARLFVSFVQRRYDIARIRADRAEEDVATAKRQSEQLQDDVRDVGALRVQYEVLEQSTTEMIEGLQAYAAQLEQQLQAGVGTGGSLTLPPQVAQGLIDAREQSDRLLQHSHDLEEHLKVTNDAREHAVSQHNAARDGLNQTLLQYCQIVDRCRRRKAKIKQLKEEVAQLQSQTQAQASAAQQTSVARELEEDRDEIKRLRHNDARKERRLADFTDKVHQYSDNLRDALEARNKAHRALKTSDAKLKRAQEQMSKANADVEQIRRLHEAASTEARRARAEREQASKARNRAVQDRDQARRDRDEAVELLRGYHQDRTDYGNLVDDIQRVYRLLRQDYDALEIEHNSVASEHHSALTSLVTIASTALRSSSVVPSTALGSGSAIVARHIRSAPPPSSTSSVDQSRPRPSRKRISSCSSSSDSSHSQSSPRPTNAARLGSSTSPAAAIQSPSRDRILRLNAGSGPAVSNVADEDEDQASDGGSEQVADQVEDLDFGLGNGQSSEDDASYHGPDAEDASSHGGSSDTDDLESDSDDEEMLVAQARSRSDARRRRLSSGDGSAAAPIVICGNGSPDDPSDNPSNNDDDQATAGSRTCDCRRSSALGSREDHPALVRHPHARGHYSVTDLGTRRDVSRESGKGVSYLDPSAYCLGLITKAIILALYDKKPWKTLASQLPAPLTCSTSSHQDVTSIAEDLDAFEADEVHLQTLWEVTHAFQIPKKKRDKDPWMAAFYSARKKRSSYSRGLYRLLLKLVIARMRRTGRCDLDLSLDPRFMHFPRPGEDTTWFPGREVVAEGRAPPATLLEAMADCDRADPWRNHFRTAPETHPSLQIARLRHKFVPAPAERANQGADREL